MLGGDPNSSYDDLVEDDRNALEILDDYFTGVPWHTDNFPLNPPQNAIDTNEAESAVRTSRIARIAVRSRRSTSTRNLVP